MNRWKSFCIAAFLLLMTGCVEDVDMSGVKPSPKLVVNCMAGDNLPVMALVSRTFFLFADRDSLQIPDAEIRLFVNEEDKGLMTFVKPSEKESGFYLSSYVSKGGDRIRIEATATDFPVATAETQVPQPVLIDKIEVIKDTLLDWRNEYINYKYKITFTDPGHEKNYYYISCQEGFPVFDVDKGEFTEEYVWHNIGMDYGSDPLFSSELTALEYFLDMDWLFSGGRVFSDHLINGKSYTITIEPEYYSGSFLNDFWFNYLYAREINMEDLPPQEEWPEVKGLIVFYSLSESFYYYLKTLIELEDGKLINQLTNAGIAEPVHIYNNIKNGVGILGAYHPYSKSVSLGQAKVRE